MRGRVSTGPAASAFCSTITVLAAAACASPGTPPGGPDIRTPPHLVAVSPDTNAVGVRPREVVFTFDAVLSETPRGGATSTSSGGASGLEGVALVSPRNGSVSVDWRRQRIAVRPRQGFRPDLTYTVTLGPGLQDLRNNVQDTAAVTVFSTGGPLARQVVRGVVFDWVNGRPSPRAVVEATGTDSVTYVALADSAGRFVVPNVPAGRYLVRGTVDLNGNRAADPREAFDTVRAGSEAAPPRPAAPPAAPNAPAPPNAPARPGAPGAPPAPAPPDTNLGVAVYAFPRDTLPPRLANVAAVDSVTLRLTFDRPLRPDQSFAPRVRVLGPDSAALAVRSVLSAASADSADRAEAQGAAPRDTAGRDAARAAARAAADTVPAPQEPARAAGVPGAPFDPSRQRRPARGGAAPNGPVVAPPALQRPVPPTELVVRLAAQLRPNTTYRVRVLDVRSLNNVLGTSDRPVTTPRPTPPAPAPTPAPSRPATPPVPTPRPAPTASPRPPAAPPSGRP